MIYLVDLSCAANNLTFRGLAACVEMCANSVEASAEVCAIAGRVGTSNACKIGAKVPKYKNVTSPFSGCQQRNKQINVLVNVRQCDFFSVTSHFFFSCTTSPSWPL